MVIQRWQNFLLLISAIITLVSTFVPYANLTTTEAAVITPQYIHESALLFSLNIIVFGLAVTAIRFFKKLGFQKKLAMATIVIQAIAMCLLFYIAHTNCCDISFTAILLPILNIAVLLIASSFIKKDHKLLRSLDRLR